MCFLTKALIPTLINSLVNGRILESHIQFNLAKSKIVKFGIFVALVFLIVRVRVF